MTLSLPFATQDLQFPFSYLRMGQQGYNGPGIVLSGDMAVSPGSGLQVQIAAGEAYVQQTVARLGAFYASRGIYYIFNDSTGAPYNTITAPVTYPRVDQVIARVYDTYEQQLTGNSYWRFEWLMGTETDGATLENRDGAAALPANSLCLSYNLATVGMSSWSSENILNVAQFASGRGIANGVASLDSTGNVPADQLNNILTCVVSRPTRVFSTPYQPNVDRPTLVTIGFSSTGTGWSVAVVSGSESSDMATIVQAGGDSDYDVVPVTFLVAPGWYYQFEGGLGSPTVVFTTEWTL